MKTHDLVIAILVIILFLLISLPYQFEFSYWAESALAWAAYFLVGAILAVYVFYIFLQARRRLISEGESDKEVSS